MKFGSVCSGIEAASVAWHPLGWRAAWLAEIEPFPSALLAHHYPDVPNIGDMTKLLDLIPSGKVEAPDVFCGGTPCQAFSVAGLRKSLDDARGNLSLIFCEIANAIDTVRVGRGDEPAIVFWENVPGVLSTADNAFGCFLAGLAGEDDPLVPPGGKWTNAGCVYGPQRAVAWRVTDAQYFGVAQRRRRVFVVASARKGFDPAAVLFEFDGVRRDSAPSREAGQGTAAGTIRSTDGGSDVDHARAGHLPITMAHGQGGAEIGFDRGPTLTCNHEAPIAAYAIQAGALRTNPASGPDGVGVQADQAYTLEARSEVQAICVTGDIANTLKAEGFDASEDGTGRGTPLVPVAGAICRDSFTVGMGGRPEGAAAGHVIPAPISFGAQMSVPQVDFDLNQTLQAKNPMAVAFSSKDHGADATAELCPTLRAMNHAESHANGGGQMAVAFQPGNLARGAGSPPSTEVFPTLKSDHGRGLSDQQPHVLAPVTAFQDRFRGDDGRGYDRPPAMSVDQVGTIETVKPWNVATAMQVRRLTPRECERLQGFQFRVTPDYPGAWQDAPGEWWSPDYTLIPGKAKKINPDKLDRDYVKYLARGGRMSFEECCQAAADGPRYKALGNSWAVPNVRWIGERIAAQLAKSDAEAEYSSQETRADA